MRRFRFPRFNPVQPPIEWRMLGKRLQGARESAGYYQHEAAASIGIHPTHLSQIENARRPISVFELVALCHLYNVRIPWIVTGAAAEDSGTAALDVGVSYIASDLQALPDETRDRLVKQFRALLRAEVAEA